MSETSFEVVFDGPGVEGGRMPVRDFAPALLALGDLFVEASAVVHPGQPPAALKIRATKRGSFSIDLVLEAPKIWDEFVTLFNSGPVNAIVNFRDLIIGGAGLYWFIKKAEAEKIKKREASLDPAMIRVEFEDGTTAEVPADLLHLYDNVRIRQRVRETVEPVNRDGVERLEFRRDHEVSVEVQRDDVKAYEPPELEEIPLLDQETQMVLSIASVVFTEGNKWRFTDGEQRTFPAAIDDAEFIKRVNAGVESFRAGDMLRCRVHVKQTRRGDALHTDYTVVEVKNHIPRHEQLGLAAPPEMPRELPPADEDAA